MLPEDAIAAAEEEGLDLVRADGSPTGFWGVRQRGNRFVAAPRVSGENSSRHLGMFDSAEEAALAIARWIRNTGATPSARKARKLEHTAAPTISLEEATAQAAAEGLTFLVDASNPTGFRGVYKSNSAVRPFYAKVLGRKKTQNVGKFATAHEAALAIARALGPQKVAESAAAPSRNSGGWLVTAERTMGPDEATRLAREEGLVLRLARHRRAFWNVKPSQTRADGTRPWIAYVPCEDPGELGSAAKIFLGTFACPEAGALAIARRLRDDPRLRAIAVAAHARDGATRARDGATHTAQQQQRHSAVEEEAAPAEIVEVESVEVEAWSDDDEPPIVVEAVCV